MIRFYPRRRLRSEAARVTSLQGAGAGGSTVIGLLRPAMCQNPQWCPATGHALWLKR